MKLDFDSHVERVISCLKNSSQTLVFLDSIECPVRKIVPDAPSDRIMSQILQELKTLGIVHYGVGHMANARCQPGDDGYVYFTSFTLSDEFFEKCCSRPAIKIIPKQLELEF